MPRVALTDEQRAKYELEDLCSSVIESIEYAFMVKQKKNRKETADALGVCQNTWTNWRKSNLESCGFRDVAMALRKAGYQIKVEPRGGRT